MSASCRLCHRGEPLDPRVLSCSHVFCHPCLDNWLWSGEGHGTAAIILCPFCRSSCPLPEGGVRALPSLGPPQGALRRGWSSPLAESPDSSFKSKRSGGGAMGTGSRFSSSADVYVTAADPGSMSALGVQVHGVAGGGGGHGGAGGYHHPYMGAAARGPLVASVSFDSSISEDEYGDTVADWQTQTKKDMITVYNETHSALAEAPKPRLLWRVGWKRLSGPYDVQFLPGDGGLVVVETKGRRVSAFSRDGGTSRVLVDELDPSTAAVSPDGTVSVTDTLGGRVVVLAEGRQPEQWVPKGLVAPQGITRQSTGGWAVTDAEQHTLAFYSPKGRLLRHIGGYGDSVLNFNEPMHVTCDAHNRILVSDCENHSVKVFDPAGEKFLFQIGGCQSDADGLLNFPYGVCVDRRNQILVADYGNARVSAFSADGKFVRHLLTSDDVIRGPRGLAYEGEGSHSARVAVTGCWMQKLWVHRVAEF